jgi:hypothetical protein
MGQREAGQREAERDRVISFAEGAKVNARMSNVIISPGIPDAVRVLATMLNWWMPA